MAIQSCGWWWLSWSRDALQWFLSWFADQLQMELFSSRMSRLCPWLLGSMDRWTLSGTCKSPNSCRYRLNLIHVSEYRLANLCQQLVMSETMSSIQTTLVPQIWFFEMILRHHARSYTTRGLVHVNREGKCFASSLAFRCGMAMRCNDGQYIDDHCHSAAISREYCDLLGSQSTGFSI